MKIKMQRFKRISYLFAALTVAAAGLLQSALNQRVHAFPTGLQLVNREIRISSSASGATGTTYLVAFQPASNYTVKGIIVDFCGGASSTTPGTPIINDPDCDLPTGFDLNDPGPNPDVTTTSVDVGDTTSYVDLGDNGGTWVATDQFSNGQSLRLTNSTGVPLTAGTKYAFTINNVTNPTPNETFYARIITYTSDTEDVTTYTHSAANDALNTNEAKDYGGIALSVASQINITARVRESLTFCVASATITSLCGNAGANPPNLLLANTNESIVDTTDVSVDSAFIQASTNAQSGVVVRMKNEAACVGLSRDGGATCDLHAIGETVGTTTNLLTSGVSPNGLFGMYVDDGTTALASQAPYSTVGSFAMDGTATGVGSTYGDIISASSTVLDSIENELVFGARASSTTPAGLYTATLILNATGTF